MTEIMDVSRYQGTIDWEKVKASGKVDGVMIRAMGNSAAGRPSAPYTDPQFARNYSECKRLGIPCGVYPQAQVRGNQLAECQQTCRPLHCAGRAGRSART